MAAAAKQSIPRDHIVNFLREQGFSFRRQVGRVEIYRHSGSKRRVEIVRKDFLDPDAVRSMLRQAGLDRKQIEGFVGDSRAAARPRASRR